jgi:anti-sigma regulatory factor (Ser/Thr protein kinase)
MSDDLTELTLSRLTSVVPPPRRDLLLHEALVYSSDEEFLAGAVPFLLAAVETGERAFAATTPDRIALLETALAGNASEIEFVDANEWFRVPAWSLGAYHRYLHGHDASKRVWLLGEPPWSGRTLDQTLELQRCDSILNIAFAGTAASILCVYDSRVVSPAILASARQTHPALTRGDSSVRSPGYVPPAEFTARNRVQVAPAPTATLSLAFSMHELAAVRRATVSWARGERVSDHMVRELLIAVHEVVSNAVEHGGGTGMARFWTVASEVMCEVFSPGRFDHPFPGYLPPDTAQERGRGLWIARQICSRVDVESREDGTRVRLTLPRG